MADPYDSADVIDPELVYYAFTLAGFNIDNHRDVLRNGNYESISGFGDVTFYIGPSEGEWAGGEEVKATYILTSTVLTSITSDLVYMSHVKKLGAFPLGCITDGQGYAFDTDFYEGFSPYSVNGSGAFNELLGERIGEIHFLPNAQFKNGHPTPIGRVPRASEYVDGIEGEGFGMMFLIWENSEMIDYVINGNSDIGFPSSGGPVNVIDPRDYTPTPGHIIRLIPHRKRRSFNGNVTPTDPSPPIPVMDLGLLAGVDLDDLNSTINVDLNGAQYRAADNTWFTIRASNFRGIVGYAQIIPPVQAPGDTFSIFDSPNNVIYLIHGTVIA